MDTVHVLTTATDLRVREYEQMRTHTNFRIGGPARYYVEARTADEVRAAVDFAREANVPWFVLGGGSNTLVADAGFDGVVIQLANREVRMDGTRVIAGAGAIASSVARAAGDAGLTGFEWAISLPGTIGGGVRGNAGCFGGEMAQVVERIDALDGSNELRIMNYGNEACAFRYRHSTFKDHPDWIVLEATLALTVGDPAVCATRMAEHLERRKTKQPLERPSAGCLFTNIEDRDLTDTQCTQLDAATDGAWRAVVHNGQLPTGWLIERLGLKGYRVGNIMVSEKHGNFVINLGGGTAADVLVLMDAVKARAREVYGIELKEEVQRLGL